METEELLSFLKLAEEELIVKGLKKPRKGLICDLDRKTGLCFFTHFDTGKNKHMLKITSTGVRVLV